MQTYPINPFVPQSPVCHCEAQQPQQSAPRRGWSYLLLQRTYVFDLCRGAAHLAQDAALRIQQLLQTYKQPLVFVATSAIAATLDPGPFFSGAVAGFLGDSVIELLSEAPPTSRAFFLEHFYETSIIQSALLTVQVACRLLQGPHAPPFGPRRRDGVVGSTLSGVVAGAALAAAGRRLYGALFE